MENNENAIVNAGREDGLIEYTKGTVSDNLDIGCLVSSNHTSSNDADVPEEVSCEEPATMAEEIKQDTMSIEYMANALDDIGRVLESQRKMFNIKEELANACHQFGISEEDQNIIHENMIKFTKKHENVNIVDFTKTKSVLDKTFFLRADGSIIAIKNPLEKKGGVPGSFDEFEVKKSLVTYIQASYQFDVSVQKDIVEINKSMEDFRVNDVAEASAKVSSVYKQNLECNIANAEQAGDEKNKKQLVEWKVLRSAYTFESYLNMLDTHKSIAENTIKDITNNECLVQVGALYRKRLQSSNTHSTLFPMVHDDISKSLEATFLPKEDYAAGYENLFIFGLIRFFSKENWDKPITKRLHNATVILLTNLQNHTLPEDTANDIIAGMTKVWGHFLPVISKK